MKCDTAGAVRKHGLLRRGVKPDRQILADATPLSRAKTVYQDIKLASLDCASQWPEMGCSTIKIAMTAAEALALPEMLSGVCPRFYTGTNKTQACNNSCGRPLRRTMYHRR